MAAPAPQARKDLSVLGLLASVRRAFITVPDTRRQASVKYSMTGAPQRSISYYRF